ncbi:MAG: T9SS type A sorting domain-containing protein [candidate division Zixibacteria bacterium]|nr:T9SS type A sorting domain-containing protein [candidate division Zixibacteria bacterium]
MKKRIKISLIIIFLIISNLVAAQAADDIFTYNVTTEMSEISVVETDRGIKYRIGPENYLEIEGAPEIPFKIVRLALPANTRIGAVTANGSNINRIAQGAEIAWHPGDMQTDLNMAYIPASKDEELYRSNEAFPGKYVELLNKGAMGEQHLACFAVYPLQYRPASGELVFVGEIEIRIELESHTPPSLPNTAQRSSLIHELVDNPLDISGPSPSSSHDDGIVPGTTIMGLGAEYLIITSGELAPAFYPFAVWKNQKGWTTEIVLIEDILARYSGEDQAAQLREYLKEANMMGAQWVLLGGDEDIIPIRYAYPGNTSTTPALRYQQVSDLYYADLTGEWDTDGDGIYGEYLHDDPDIFPEVYVGRIPAVSVEEVEIWVGKALMYEQNPNNGDFDYLTRGLFIINDQMRDLNQHIDLANLMPDNFYVDNSSCAEEPSGNAQNPTQPTGEDIVAAMNEGWGYISNHNHGGFYYYAAKTTGYNNNPRSDMFGDTLNFGNGTSGLCRLDETNKYGVHYSISCYTAAYDFDKEVFWPGPFMTNNSFMEAYLFLPDKGGVAYLGNTRWGWVSSSNLIEKKFVEYVFSDTARHLAVAETMSKLYYPTKRDLGYGHSVFGDPEMMIWANPPTPLNVSVPSSIPLDSNTIKVEISTSEGPIRDVKVTAWKPGEFYARGTTDQNGFLEIPLSLAQTGDMYITAVGIDLLPSVDTVNVYLQSSVGDDSALPLRTTLASNYPNPFNANTEISFALPNESRVELEIFDIAGRKVKTLVDDYKSAGTHIVTWNGFNDQGKVVSSGTYFYRLRTDGDNLVKKMALLK